MPNENYLSIKDFATGQIKDKGSRFIGLAFPIQKEEEVKIILTNIKKKYHDATHHCYAFSVGFDNKQIVRCCDDGEPSSTAGKPILGQIIAHHLQNILVVVVRYFGGTKLGVSGLINAYRECAKTTLENAEIVQLERKLAATVSFTYQQTNAVMQILKNFSADIKENAWADDKMKIICFLNKGVLENMTEQLQSLKGVEFVWKEDV